ncbi:MAG TPA: undecaprenyl-diphosphate phosphatase [Verrucomicrobiae bacterium]|jgi:undecaprenyl-diphosphatase|nr:undecaprenyl-diphosphate phosphatase [Verrucomicrobiae bacterium]
MTDPVSAVILGIVEGITEFLPVSSTGHLLIAEKWVPVPSNIEHDLFNVVIQPGAVLAVIPLFHKRFHQFIFNWNDAAVRSYLFKIITAFVITGIGGLVMVKKGFKLPETFLPVAIALLIGGVLFLIVEWWLAKTGHSPGKDKERGDLRDVTWPIAIAVGIGQLIAAGFPGASRSGTTIIFCLILGLGRPLATEFSFIVGIPTMLAAGGYTILKAVRHPIPGAPHQNWPMVILASVVAAVVSFIAVKWLLRYVQTHTFVLFGWYRVLIGGALLVALAMKLI